MTKIITHGRTGTNEYFQISGVLTAKELNHTPFLVFVIDGDTVDVQIATSALALYKYPPDTQVMAQWSGSWRSDFFQFTVGDVLNALNERKARLIPNQAEEV